MKLVFVSHCTEDSEAAEIVAKGLADHLHDDCQFFLAKDINPGAEWIHQIRDHLRRAEALVVVISKDSLNHPWVGIEVGAAWVLGKRIIPIRLDDLPEHKDLPEPLRQHQIYDARRNSITDKSAAVKTLLQQFANDLTEPFNAEHRTELVHRINETLKTVKDDFQRIRNDQRHQSIHVTPNGETEELSRTFLELTSNNNKMLLGEDLWEPLWQKYEAVRVMWDRAKDWNSFEAHWAAQDRKIEQLMPQIPEHRFHRRIDEKLVQSMPELAPYEGSMAELIIRD